MSESPDPPLAAAGDEATNLAELIDRQAHARPEAVALVEPAPERRTRTWREVADEVDAVAAGLAGSGLVAGQRVGICGPNSIEFVLAYFAALRAGFVAVPINPGVAPTELTQLVADSGLRMLLTATPRPEVEVPQVPLTEAGLHDLGVRGAPPVDFPRDRESLAVLLYTAGTSGRPKAAMLSHRALLAHLTQIAPSGVVTADTVALAMVPLFHVFGLNAVLGSWAYAGARLVIMDGYQNFFDVIADEQVTNLPVAPAVLNRLVTDDRCTELASTVTTVLSGAAPLSFELRTAFTERTGLRVDQGYGLTEAAPGVSVTFGTQESEHVEHGFVGRPLPGVEVRIGDGSEPTEPGEISVRGANLFSGYWPDGAGGPDADGWFATGDIGYLNGDDLFLLDRARELIIVNGFNVFPAEIEEAIGELDGVDAVAVVGRPDDRTGEHVVAFVVGSVTEAAVAEHCAGRLAKFKRPVAIKIVDGLPRGATGKVQKGHLRRDLDLLDA